MAAAVDNFPLNGNAQYPELYSPLYNITTISPSDSTDLVSVLRGIAFATTGQLTVDMIGAGGVKITTFAISTGVLASGTIHPLRISRVYSTGTSITSIVGFW